MTAKHTIGNTQRPSLWPQILIAALTLAAVAAALWLGHHSYLETRKLAAEQFNQQQLILARSAAAGIEAYYQELSAELVSLARLPAIQQTAPESLQYMQHAYWGFPSRTSIRLLDSDGVLRYIYPYDGWREELVGRDYSGESYFQKARETGIASISGLIINEQGDERIRITLPVYQTYKEEIVNVGEETGIVITGIEADKPESGQFQGVLLGSFDPHIIAQDIISPIVSGQTGYAWLLNEKGTFLAHYEQGFVGQDAFESRAERNPDISYDGIKLIQQRMMAGEEGTGRYVSGWHRGQVGEVEKLVAFTPVNVNAQIWSVAVCAPVSEVDAIVHAAGRSELYTLSFVILALMAGGIYLLVISRRWSHSLEREVDMKTGELRESEEHYRLLAENISDIIWTADMNLRLTYISSSVTRMLGYSVAEALPLALGNVFPPASFEIVMQAFAEELAVEDMEHKDLSRSRTLELEYYRKDGSTIWTELKATGLRDPGGQPVGILGVTRDITERKQAEQTLRESEERHRTTFEATGTAVIIIEEDTTISLVNAEFSDLCGYSKDEVEGKKNWTEFVAQDDLERMKEHHRLRRTAEKAAPRNYEFRFIDRWGNAKNIFLTVAMIPGTQKSVASLLDITERVRAEDESVRLSNAVRMSSDSIVITDLEGKIVDVNEATLEMYGTDHAEDLIGKSSFDLITIEERGKALSGMQEVLEKGYFRNQAYHVIAQNGSRVPVEMSVAIMQDANGNPTGFVGVSRDITERARADSALRDSEERYRLLAENISDIIWTVDMNLRFTYISSSVTRMIGYSVAEALALTLGDIFPPASFEIVMQAFVEELAVEEMEHKDLSRSRTLELECYCQDGSTIWTELKATGLRDPGGQLVGFLGVTRDITERVQAAEALRKSEKRYHALFKQTNDAVFLISLDGIHLEVNPQVSKMLGYPDDEVIGRPFYDFLVPEEKQMEVSKMAQLLDGQTLPVYERTFLHKDGTMVLAEINVSLVSDSTGKPLFIHSVVRDITERVQAEKELRESEKRYRSLFEGVPIGIYRSTQQGQILDANPALVKMLGYPNREALLAINASDLYVDPNVRVREQVLQEREWDMRCTDKQLQRRDGTVIWARDTLRVVQDAESQALYHEGSLEDITERLRALAALQESEEDFRLLAENSIDCIWKLDTRLRFTYLSPASEKLVGYKPEQMVGTKLSSHFKKREFFKAGALAARALKDYKTFTHVTFETKMLNSKNEEVDVEISSQALLDSQGKLIGLQGITRDITGRKLAQEALLERTEEIELLYEAGQQISQTLDTETIYSALHGFVSRFMACDSLIISSFDPGEELIHCDFAINEGNPLDVSQFPPIPLEPEGQGTQSVVIRSGEALVIGDYQARMKATSTVHHFDDGGTIHGRDELPGDEEVTRSAIIVPLKLAGRVVGIIQVMSYRLEAYSEADLRILESLASQIAVASNNALLYRQAQRRQRELALLNRVIMAASTTLDPKAVLETTCRELALAFDLPQAGAALLNEERTASIVVAEYLAEGRSSALGVVISLEGNPATQYVVEHKAPLAVADAQHDPRMAAIHDVMRQRGVISILILPLMARGQVVGTLGLDAVERREFSDDEIALAANAAAAAAQALENARLYQAEQHRRSEAELLREAARAVSTSLEIDEILRLILTQLKRALVYTAASVLILREDNIPELVVGSGYADETLTSQETQDLLRSSPILRQMARDLQPVVSADVRKLEGWIRVPGAEHIRAWLGIPLVVRGRMTGALMVDSTQPDFFGEADLQIAQSLAQLAAQALENARLFSEAKRRLERLEALHTIDKVISSSVDINMTMGVFLDQVLTQLEVDAAGVLLFDPFMQTLECIGRKGFRTSALQHTHLRLGQGLAGQVALKRETKYVPDLQKEEEVFRASPDLSGEEFVAYYGIPLVAKGVLKGVLEIFHRSPLSADDEWLGFLNALGSQAAIAIDNASMFNDLQRSNLELGLAYDSTLEGWAKALELKDMETEGHSRRVVDLTMQLARQMGVGRKELVHIRRGALLHDIGKMGIPDSILQKSGPLTGEEWRIMRKHPGYAFEWLSSIEYLRPALDIPYSHHEKWDGTGYPGGLRGEAIPLPARIFAIVDMWDALNSDRPYREAWPEEKVLENIREQSGKHFDPRVVEAFLAMIGRVRG